MSKQNENQIQLDFSNPEGEEGYRSWMEQRRAAMEVLARKHGLPLGHDVEVWLFDGIRLRGRLELSEEKLFVPEERNPDLELRIDRATFTPREIESCVRMD